MQQQIKKHNIQKTEDIFLAEYWNDKVNFILTDGKINRVKE